jgi:hypothetical protein
VRHRFVFSGIYALPFHGNFHDQWLAIKWHFATAGRESTLGLYKLGHEWNGRAQFVQIRAVPISRERVSLANGSVQYLPQSICYAATAGCTFSNPVNPDGAQGRNSIYGPGYEDTRPITRQVLHRSIENPRLEFRADAFNLLNHPNLGQPVSQFTVGTGTVTAGTFGQITNTRFPLGDSGSSRQLQLSLKLLF